MQMSNSNSSRYNGLQIDQENYIPNGNNNCYTYAINQPINPYTKQKYENYGYCQPGYLGGKKKEGRKEYLNYEEFSRIIEFVNKDLNDIGYEIIKTTYEEYIEDENCWKVALCYNDYDYHWYRQNIDGTWSHKLGKRQEARNYDESNEIIYDPRVCDRGSYDHFEGFYMIRKKIDNKNYWMCA